MKNQYQKFFLIKIARLKYFLIFDDGNLPANFKI